MTPGLPQQSFPIEQASPERVPHGLGDMPDALSLVAESQRALTMLPEGSAERDYVLRMVGSALGMVERSIAAGSAAETAILAPSRLHGVKPAELVAAIRRGDCDADPALFEALIRASLVRCALTKPQRLTQTEREAARALLSFSPLPPSTSR
jgi:hypothetical protein